MDLPTPVRPSVPVPRSPALHQRAGDLERNAVCDELATHFAAGRLRADELDARLGAAMAAPTLLELRALVSDLPRPVTAPAAVARPVAGSWTVWDVVALLTVLGCLAFAGLATLALGLDGQGLLLAAGFFGGSVAATGGAALTHLLHRARQRAAVEGQRPRMA